MATTVISSKKSLTKLDPFTIIISTPIAPVSELHILYLWHSRDKEICLCKVFEIHYQFNLVVKTEYKEKLR